MIFFLRDSIAHATLHRDGGNDAKMADIEKKPEKRSLELQPSQDGMHPARMTFASEAGTKYGTCARQWQGILGIERAGNCCLWATWDLGVDGECPGKHFVLTTYPSDGANWFEPVLVIAPSRGRRRKFTQ